MHDVQRKTPWHRRLISRGQDFLYRMSGRDTTNNFGGPLDLDNSIGDNDDDSLETEREIGVPGNVNGEREVERLDYNADWNGQNAINNAEKMRRSDGSVRSILQVTKLPILRAIWNIKPANDATEDPKDIEIAKFCHDNLIGGKWTTDTWNQRLQHALTMLDFGFAVNEIIWDLNEDEQFVVVRIAPRLARTIERFKVSQSGDLEEVHQRAIKRGSEKPLRMKAPYVQVFTYEKEGANYWGIPILRYMWSHYYYKTELYRIDAIRADRFGVGIPDATIKAGYQMRPNEKREVINILKGLRSHQQAYMIHPEEIEISIKTPDNEHGGVSGLGDMADHHDVMMTRVALALFLTAGSQKHGNYGTTIAWADMFLYALQALAMLISDLYEKTLIKQLCDYNFDMTGREYPKMRASSLEDTNLKELAAMIYNLTLARALTPDDNLEQHLRRLAGMPSIEKGYSRKDRGVVGQDPLDPGAAAPNTITGKSDSGQGDPLNNEPRAPQKKGTTGTQVSKTPAKRGPVRAPGDLSVEWEAIKVFALSHGISETEWSEIVEG